MSGAGPVAGVLLAAGAATRMGQPKQLLDWGGRPLVRVAAEQALAGGLDDLLAVVANLDGPVAAALAGLRLRTVACPDPAAGQSASLHAGLAALMPDTAALLVLLADQPFVSGTIVARLIAEWRASGAEIVAPSYRGVRGNPVLFARTLVPELLTITGDRGARDLIGRDPDRVRLVAFDDDRPLADIDTPEEYARLRPAP